VSEDALIICTVDRPGDLGRCLASVRNQTVQPALILVVDGCPNGSARPVASAYGAEWLAAPRGLTLQRNAGVAVLPSTVDTVHFIDDDVVLEPEYLEGIRDALTRPEVIGAGGVITNAPPAQPYLLRRIFILDSRRPGVALASGRGTLAGDPPTVTQVDWLSGCSMSFRRRVLDENAFDSGLRGYALGEDLDFALTIRHAGALVVTPRARLVHNSSSIGRLDSRRWAEADVITRWRRVRRHAPRLRRSAFWWSIAGDVLLVIAQVASGRRSALRRFLGIVDGIRAICGGQAGKARWEAVE
jgi:GT2 family glycosyltransferase